MRNSNGKAGTAIVVLTALILVALVPWVFVILNILGSEDNAGLFPAPTEEPEAVETEPPDDTEPEPEQTPPDPDEPNTDEAFEPVYDEDVYEISVSHPQLKTELNTSASLFNCAAASLVVFNAGTGEYFTYEYGRADVEAQRKVNVDTKFRVASLSKLVTVICTMVLVDEGLVDLDADISLYFGYEVRNSNYQDTPITARMLMQHTSSFFDSGAFQASRDRNSSEPVKFLIERGSSFRRNQPGTNYEYTNFGYAVLGALCERVSGKTLDSFAREVLFEPLGIDAAYVPANLIDTDNIAVIYNERHTPIVSVQDQLDVGESDTPGYDLHLAQGNLTISAVDYARILAMLGNKGMLKGVRILSADAVESIHEADVQGPEYQQGLATRYSFGDFIPDEGFYWHTGSLHGTYAQYVYSEDMKRGVVIVTSGATVSRLTNGMIDVCTDMSLRALSEIKPEG